MPYIIETRKVSVAKWYNPFTWGKFRMEWRREWDMDGLIHSDEERRLFIQDQLKWQWKQTTPPIRLTFNKNTLNEK